uniref:DUF1985 domain-containing protein n=1 Tax=Brassica oleracea var. oleracea TaxID=109376 RepID=A0A0D3E8M1_BRAOL
MGGHTFSVMFLQYIISRQLVTEKELELWWFYVGNPIRYAIKDFALVTGLNCGERGLLDGDANERGIGRGKGTAKARASTSIWDELFCGEVKPTVGWIMDRLFRGEKYKDPLTRLRLSLLVLVEGILCPTCGTTNIRPEVSGGGDPLTDSSLSTADIIRSVVERKLVVNLVTAKSVDQLGQVSRALYFTYIEYSSGMPSGDWRGQSSKQQGHEPQPGENIPLDVPTFLRMAADAYEERVMPMFEGYVLSLKGHFNREVGVLRTDLQSATTSIRQLETSVTTEFEDMKKLIKGPGYNDEEPPIGGGIPYRQYSPYRGPDHDVRDAFVPPAKGNASAPVYAASTTSPGVSKSGEDNVPLPSDIGSMRTQGHRVLSPDPPRPSVPQTEFSESAPVAVDSHGGPSDDKYTESMGPVTSNVEPPPAQSTGRRDHVVVEPMETHTHDSHEAQPQDPLSPVSESNIVSDQELPHPSPAPANVAAGPRVSSKFVPENEKETISVGGETHGSDPVEEPSELGVEKNDEVDGSSNPSPSKFKGAGDVPAADDAAGDGARRVSKHKHNSPQRFSPSEPTVRKVLPVFIGGFNAFAPPTPANRDAFLKRLNAAKSVDVSSGSSYSISSLGHLFHCNGALDRVVTFISNRRDRLPSARFEFIPPSFFLELMRNYAGFDAIKEKHKFVFSTPIKPQFMHRPG